MSTNAVASIVERFAEQSVADLLKTYADRAGHLAGAGVVVGSQVDPATIKQDHIRAHAEEGRLFRSVIVDAAKRSGYIPCWVAPAFHWVPREESCLLTVVYHAADPTACSMPGWYSVL